MLQLNFEYLIQIFKLKKYGQESKSTCMFSNFIVVAFPRNSNDFEHLYENPIGALGGSPTTFSSIFFIVANSSNSTEVNDQ